MNHSGLEIWNCIAFECYKACCIIMVLVRLLFYILWTACGFWSTCMWMFLAVFIDLYCNCKRKCRQAPELIIVFCHIMYKRACSKAALIVTVESCENTETVTELSLRLTAFMIYMLLCLFFRIFYKITFRKFIVIHRLTDQRLLFDVQLGTRCVQLSWPKRKVFKNQGRGNFLKYGSNRMRWKCP